MMPSTVISLNRPATTYADLLSKEAAELSEIYNYVETTLRSKVGAEKFNYLSLMMVDLHVHTHVIPRYSSTFILNQQAFTDKNWPMPPDILTTEDISIDTVEAAKRLLRG